MPRATVGDTSLTRSYIPKVSQTHGISPSIAHFYKPIEDRCIHKGRVVDQLYYTSDHIVVFTNEWDLGSLAYSHETEGPYDTDVPTPEEIHQFLQFQRVDTNRKIKHKNVILSPNQVLTKELRQYLKRWNELIYENVFGLGGHRYLLPAYLFLPSSDVETRWVKFIPIKVNVFSWRARRDRLPTRVNLSRRGVLLDSHMCPLCNAAMEDVQHVFFRCDVARVVL
ncbi:ribosomal protein L7Ae/L30e/S12e/Gadd45, partial [Tanacetum coccineum]